MVDTEFVAVCLFRASVLGALGTNNSRILTQKEGTISTPLAQWRTPGLKAKPCPKKTPAGGRQLRLQRGGA